MISANDSQTVPAEKDADVIPALLTQAIIRARFLPVGERTFFRLISSGKFPRADVAIGGKLRLWRRETVEAWIKEKSGQNSENHR